MNRQDLDYYFNQYKTYCPIKDTNIGWDRIFLITENRKSINVELVDKLRNYIYPEIEKYYGHINFGFDILCDWNLKPKYNSENKNYDQYYRLQIHFIFRLPNSKKLSDIDYIYQLIEGGETKLELDHMTYKNTESKEVSAILKTLLEELL